MAKHAKHESATPATDWLTAHGVSYKEFSYDFVKHGGTHRCSQELGFDEHATVNTHNKGAGIDISPAVRDYLGIPGGTAIVHWRFVEFYRIPRGPWSKWGDNNPFVNPDLGPGKRALQTKEDRLRQQQEAIQRELMKDPAKLRRQLQG